MSDLLHESIFEPDVAKLDHTDLPDKIAPKIRISKQIDAEDESDPIYNEFGERRLSNEERRTFKRRVAQAEEELYANIKGQDQAIAPVISALKRAATGARDEARPMATILEVGPTGTGKTLLGKVLARALSDGAGEPQFGFVKVDCSEFSQGHEMARLVGSPPGYVGYNDPPQLSALIENPFQVVLFDEIEKAHPKFHNLLLQILEDGELTLGKGEKVSFRNTIILLSSNAAVRDLDQAINSRQIGFNVEPKQHRDFEQMKALTVEALKRVFPPEFINRIDEVVGFNSFTPEVFVEIVASEIRRAAAEIRRNSGCQIVIDRAVTQMLADETFNPSFGAREVRRSVDRSVRQAIAEALFEMDPDEVRGSTIRLSVKDGALVVKQVKGQLPLSLRKESLLHDRLGTEVTVP